MQSSDALVERLFTSLIGALDLFAIYLGDRLGFYSSLAAGGPATSTELATRTKTAERYVREWLEQQAVTGILSCENPDAAAADRRFALPEGYEAVLVDPDSLMAMAPMARVLAGVVHPLAAITEAFRTGAGVPFEAYGEDMRGGLAGGSRPMFAHQLTQEWLPAMPDIHARLTADPPARVADIGMGSGLSSLAIARAYPGVFVDGFDLDAASVEDARANAAAAGMEDRVTFHCRDAGDPDLAGQYDFALAVECIHDMSDPVAALRAMRRLVGEGGTVLIADERTADRFTAPGDDLERFFYGVSILHCLPVGMVDQPSVATGTVMRADTFRGYAEQAGFQGVEILPVENDFFRFYRLTA